MDESRIASGSEITSCPVRREDVQFEELDGEVAIWDPEAGSLYVLNASAAAVWTRIDGHTTVADLAHELGEVFGVEPDRLVDDVDQAIRGFGDAGLLEGTGPQRPAGAGTGESDQPEVVAPGLGGAQVSAREPRFLPQVSTGCSAQALDQLGWAGHVTLRLGEVLVNVRSDTTAALAAIQTYLRGSVVPTIDGTCLYAVQLGAIDKTAPSSAVPLSVLYRGTCAAFRSRYPAEVLAVLGSHLSGHLVSAAAPLRLQATMLLADEGGLIVLPDGLRQEAAMRQRRLATAGLELVHQTACALVPGSADVELPGRLVGEEVASLATFDRIGAQRVQAWREPVGRLPVTMCVVPGRGEPLSPVSPAEGVHRLASMVVPVDESQRSDLFTALSTLARSVNIHTQGSASPRTVLEEILVRRASQRP